MDDVTVGPIDLGARVDEALAVQALAFGLDDAEVTVRRGIVARHAGYPGVRAFGAVTRTADHRARLVGFGYGMPNDRSHWWSGVIQPYLAARGELGWLDGSFVVTELHVLPRYQHRGIGRTLIRTLCADVAEPRSLLSAIDAETPARRLYRSLGYRDLVGGVRFPGAVQRYAVMGAVLPLV